MIGKYSLVAILSISVSAVPFEAARAQEGIVGGIIGGIIGGAIANQQRPVPQQRVQTQQRPRVQQARPTVNTAQRQQNRAVQTALNHFGWNVGSADGVIGPRSREGISRYQAFLGFGATGQLSEFERNILLTAHQRAIIGGPAVAQTVAAHPQGLRGLVLAVRDEMSGRPAAAVQTAGTYGLPAVVAAAVDEIAASSDPSAMQLVQRAGFIQLADLNGDGRTDYIIDTSVTGSAFWCSAQACTVQVFVSTPDGYVRNDFQAFNVTPAMFRCTRGTCELGESSAPVTVAAPPTPEIAPTREVALSVPSAQPAARMPEPEAATAPAIPNFFGSGTAAERSLASHCNRVGLVSTANGGLATRETMTDPTLVLNEQFCLARTFSVTKGEEMMTQVQGVTPDQIVAQCRSFAPALAPQVAALSVQPRDEVIREMSAFVIQSGMSTDQLAATARICLSVGYKLDDMALALGSGLLLVSLGERAYGELMGHHLMLGYGLAGRKDLAMAWYELGLDPAKTEVIAPMQSDRDLLLRAALFPKEAATQPPAAAQPVALPSFVLTQD